MKDLRTKLIELRKEKGLTQEELASELQISISTIKNYESEKLFRTPDINILHDYSSFFNVSIDYLIDNNISNRTSENININKILNLSDKAIENLKNFNHNAIDLFIESEQIATINELLDLYFKFSNLIYRAKQLAQNESTIDKLAQNNKEIMDIYNSYRTNNPIITLYSSAIADLEGVYLDVLENIIDKNDISFDELKEESITIYTTLTNAIKIVKLELLEEFSKFLNNTSIS